MSSTTEDELIIPPSLHAADRFLRTNGYTGRGLVRAMEGLVNGLTPLDLVHRSLLKPEHEAALNATLPLARRNPAPHRPHAPAFF